MGNFPVDPNNFMAQTNYKGKREREKGRSYEDLEKLQKLLSQSMQFILKSVLSTLIKMTRD